VVTFATTSLEELAKLLTAKEHVTCRLMLCKHNNRWKLKAMMADLPAVSVSPFSYDYGHTAFLCGDISGLRCASWLLRNKGSFRGYRFVIPKLQPQVHSLTYPSHVQRTIWLSIPAPFSIHTINILEREAQSNDNSPIVKDGLPSFRNIASAGGELVYGHNSSSSQREPDQIVVRVSHNEAMIEHVRLTPTSALITVAGEHVSGARLELKAESHYQQRKLRRSGLHRFSFQQGLPESLWIMLSRKDRWLDYREIDLRGSRSNRNTDDLVIDPIDATAQIEGFILRGESETIEFKREVSNDKTTSFLRTVAAFANGSGGVILLGVINQIGEVIGIKGDVQKEKDRIANLIHDILVPQPQFRLENCKVRGKDVIALFVEKGESPPYGVNPGNPRFCVRRGATTQPATQEEVRGLAQANYSEPDSYWK
jgi:hypothetical protein